MHVRYSNGRNKRIKDRVSTESMLRKNKMLSVNQTMAQIKLTEFWKALNVENYPLKVKKQETAINGREMRGDRKGQLVEYGGSTKSKASCIHDGTRLWNKAPEGIKNAKTIIGAKKEIRKYCEHLPI